MTETHKVSVRLSFAPILLNNTMAQALGYYDGFSQQQLRAEYEWEKEASIKPSRAQISYIS